MQFAYLDQSSGEIVNTRVLTETGCEAFHHSIPVRKRENVKITILPLKPNRQSKQMKNVGKSHRNY